MFRLLKCAEIEKETHQQRAYIKGKQKASVSYTHIQLFRAFPRPVCHLKKLNCCSCAAGFNQVCIATKYMGKLGSS